MKILSAAQLHEADRYTIEHEPIADIDLMERAATCFTDTLCSEPLVNFSHPVLVFCGKGNNGGDGLAIARMLIERGFLHVSTYVVEVTPNASACFKENEQRLKNISSVHPVATPLRIPKIPNDAVVIDALFGSGLSRPVTGIAADVIQAINESKALVYSVDVPSGMFTDIENSPEDIVVQADVVFTFHCPKLSFLLPSSDKLLRHFRVLDIGLHKGFSEQLPSPYVYVEEAMVKRTLLPKSRFTHKGILGHALIAAGSKGKGGAAVLATQAALRSGCGLVTACIPQVNYTVQQVACPEAMVIVSGEDELQYVPEMEPYKAIGVGPGIGTGKGAVKFVRDLLHSPAKRLVIDADGLNILATERELLDSLPPYSILTPHPGEFKRLAGHWNSHLHKLQLLKDFASQYKVIIILKGAYTVTATPDGMLYFNSTGNPGMAKGGSGDVLTGIVTSLLAMGMEPLDASLAAVYYHGKAGDNRVAKMGDHALTAGDIIRELPGAFSGG